MNIDNVLNNELCGDNQFRDYYENDKYENCNDRELYKSDYWDYIMDGDKCEELWYKLRILVEFKKIN